MTMPLTIHFDVLRAIKYAAVQHKPCECVGLLTSAPGEVPVTGAYLLDARETPASAEAAPLALKKAADDIRRRSQIPRGMFHSHSNFQVFHSGTDTETIHRLLPAMAEPNFVRVAEIQTPWVESPNQAVVPVPDGQVMVIRLEPRDSSSAAFQAPSWRGTRYVAADAKETGARLRADHIELVSGGMALILDLPEGCSISSRLEDHALVRIARLFSLVVNNAGDIEAKCLVMAEAGGETFFRLDPCEVVTVSTGAQNGPGGSFLEPLGRAEAA